VEFSRRFKNALLRRINAADLLPREVVPRRALSKYTSAAVRGCNNLSYTHALVNVNCDGRCIAMRPIVGGASTAIKSYIAISAIMLHAASRGLRLHINVTTIHYERLKETVPLVIIVNILYDVSARKIKPEVNAHLRNSK